VSNSPFDRNKTKEAKLGEIITETGEQNQRDAVHIAVVPVKASKILSPGQRVGVTPDGTATDQSATPVGIVDPFLFDFIEPGQVFWLFLFQGHVTTLRHEWTHPAFPSASIPAPLPVTNLTDRKAESEAWLRKWCQDNDCPGYDAVLARVLAGDYRSNWSDEHFHFNDTDAHAEIPPEFWDHMAIVTGQTFNEPPTSFSCSC